MSRFTVKLQPGTKMSSKCRDLLAVWCLEAMICALNISEAYKVDARTIYLVCIYTDS